ncbi:MAG: TPM domain-containing protein [Melioribacteraceae bacterium]|nr:TPM domain-containing protein [Melioribacteraceae bacterium]
MQEKVIYNFFDDDDFLRISNKIREMEKITSGEIRVAIKEDRPPLSSKKDIRELSIEEFNKLNMNETRDKTGILIYVILKSRMFYILADSGINKKVDQAVWDEVRNQIQDKFRVGYYAEGIIDGVQRVGEILSNHFPIKADDTNELSNKVVL